MVTCPALVEYVKSDDADVFVGVSGLDDAVNGPVPAAFTAATRNT
jgi:hypothetical protein